MSENERSMGDQVLAELGHALRVCAGEPSPAADNPAGDAEDAIGAGHERELSAGLMRVNHAGEVSAQALYRGQALVARDDKLRRSLLEAAEEEGRHLKWCEDRIDELNGRRSLLTPLWYAGSFGIGALAGLFGDRSSLGFLAETEAQVESHLDSHLSQLPPFRRSQPQDTGANARGRNPPRPRRREGRRRAAARSRALGHAAGVEVHDHNRAPCLRAIPHEKRPHRPVHPVG